MRELMLWRHAKASRGAADRDDFARPLNERGRRSAEAVARWIATRHLMPDHVLCSSSVRTTQTAERLLSQNSQAPAISYERKLYLAEDEELFERLKLLPTTARRAMLVGHNEGIWELALQLAHLGPTDQLASLHEKFPTGAMVWLRLSIDLWEDLGAAQGELLHFVRPRDIMDEAR